MLQHFFLHKSSSKAPCLLSPMGELALSKARVAGHSLGRTAKCPGGRWSWGRQQPQEAAAGEGPR